jgi:hypothetical protein
MTDGHHPRSRKMSCWIDDPQRVTLAETIRKAGVENSAELREQGILNILA